MKEEIRFAINFPAPTGGRAGKGRNITSTIRVVEKTGHGFQIRKEFRFNVGDEQSLKLAKIKAQLFLEAIAAGKPPKKQSHWPGLDGDKNRSTDRSSLGAGDEMWRAVNDPAFSDNYEVSSLGRVRNSKTGRVLTPSVIRDTSRPTRTVRYLGVSLHANGVSKCKKIHTLVLEAFVGKRPEGMMCCHGDCDSFNNSLANLRWDTREANRRDTVNEINARLLAI